MKVLVVWYGGVWCGVMPGEVSRTRKGVEAGLEDSGLVWSGAGALGLVWPGLAWSGLVCCPIGLSSRHSACSVSRGRTQHHSGLQESIVPVCKDIPFWYVKNIVPV